MSSTIIGEGILWSLSQETVLFVKEPDKIIMRVTERIVVWDALLVCLIRIRLQGCMVEPYLGIVSSSWIDIDGVPPRACEYTYFFHLYYVSPEFS